jgi:aldehyde dehydrogenase (NAD+)
MSLTTASPSIDRPELRLDESLRWLRRFRDAIRVHHPELCALASEEIGKPRFEAQMADILPLLASCRWHLANGKRLLRPRRVRGGGLLGLGTRFERHRVPVGRVLIIATWNYPVQLLGIQLVQAVLAGNEVVVKPSERAPRTQARLVELAVAAARGLPRVEGRISIRSASREEGRRVLAEERFDHVVFTGSTAVGRAIAEVCAARLIPSTLELSGSDSAIVFADADLAAAARAVFMGVTANAGQTCMAPRRVIVAREVEQAFLQELAKLFAGAAPRALVDARAAEETAAVVAEAIAAGGVSIAATFEGARGRELRPVAVRECPVESRLFRGEHFGPALAIRTFESELEAYALHARAGQHLATTIWTRRPARHRDAALALGGAALVHFNSVLMPSAHPGVAIVGRGRSGWGASRGESGLLALTHEVCVTRSSTLFAPPVGEPDARAQRFLARMLSFPLRPAEPASPAKAPESNPEQPVARRDDRTGIHA